MTSSNSPFAGVHTALVTPFTQQGELDVSAFQELITLQKIDNIHGVVIAGSTGEGSTLSTSERSELVKIARNNISKDMVVTASAGSNNTLHAIDMQKAMEDAGAHATLQVVPYYNKPTQRGLFEHFSTIAKASKIPIILYNAAGRTGIDMFPETVAALACEHENIVGIKDANTNVERLSDLMFFTKSKRPDFLILCGEDAGFLPYLTLGGDGIIAVSSHMAATEMLAIYDSVKRLDLEYAQKIARKLNGLFKLIFSHPNPIPIKTILACMGIIEKSFRLPLCSLSPQEEEILVEKCRNYSFMKLFKARGFLQ